MREILPGLFHWTNFHERIRQEVSSYYYEPSHALIDPRVPSEGLEWFEGRQPRVILLTNRHHYRHSGRFQEAFGCPVFCNEAGLHEFVSGPEVKGFSFGEGVAPNIVALEVGAICPEETALYLKEANGGALAFADGQIRFTDGSLGFFPDFLLGDNPEEVKRELRESLRRLLGQRFEHLLFAHGLPLIGGGQAALAAFLRERQDAESHVCSGETKFLVITGEGDVYSEEEAHQLLQETGQRVLERKPLAGPISVIVAESAQ